jgi:cell division protein ZapA (FtsZ GTPase activity inhibitor)
MSKGINVEIMGQNLVVASDDGGDDRARALAKTVDEKIKTIRANGRTVSSVNLAILAALNFADELEHLRDQLERMRHDHEVLRRDHEALRRDHEALRRDHEALLDHLAMLNRRLSEAVDNVEVRGLMDRDGSGSAWK